MSTTFDVRRWATQAGIQTAGGFAVIAECVTIDELQRFAEIAIASAGIDATYPTQQGVELANCKGGKWLTVVYRDIQPGDESRTIGEHPKVSALSWSHALHDRDAALAAKAKQGEQP